MTLLSPQNVAITGTTATYNAVTASDTLRFGERLVLHVKNAHASNPTTVTVVVPGSTRGQANPDVAVTVNALSEKFIGPFDIGEATNQVITVTYSAQTSVTAALLSF